MTNSCPPPTKATPSLSPYQSLSLHLKQLHLSHMLKQWEALEQQATQEGWSYAQFLLALVHHAVIIEIHTESYRKQAAAARSASVGSPPGAPA